MNFDKNTSKNQTSEFRLFYKKDVFVYIGLILVIFCLFLIFVFPTAFADGRKNDGFTVTSKGEVALVFDVSRKDPITVSQSFLNLVKTEPTKDGYIVKIYTSEDATAFNTLLFNANEVSVKIIESTCSDSKDCIYFPVLTDSGSIYCAPHDLKIVPITGGGLIPPITG